MALLDADGRPIPAALLTRPVATPTIVGLRPAAITTSIRGLNPATLGQLLAAADQGNSYAWQVLAAEIERRDLHYLGVLSTRKRSVAQLPMTVTPGGKTARAKKISDWVQDWLDTDILRGALFHMLDAIGKGWSVMEIDWKLEPGNNRPVGLDFKPQRWFEVNYQDGETIMLRADTGADGVPGLPGGPPLYGYSSMPPDRFVVHRHPSWSGLTIQSGLTRAVAWLVMFKWFTLRDWQVFVQNYGMPLRVGKYGPEASQEDRDVLWQMVSDIAGSCAAIIPRGMEVEFVSPGGTTSAHEIHKTRADWIDEQVSKAVLGQTGTADSRQGAHASGAIHRLVQEDIERADALILQGTVNEQIIERMVRFTFGPQPVYPRVRIGRPDEPELPIVIGAIQNLGPQGFKARAQDLYDKLALQRPEEGDEVVGIIAQAQPVQPPQDDPARIQAPETRPARAPAPTGETPPAPDQDMPRQPPKGGRASLHERLGRLLELHTQARGPDLIDAMTDRLAEAASSTWEGMGQQVRDAIDGASDFAEARDRLAAVDLSAEQFQLALQDAIQLAFLLGDAAALEAIDPGALTHGR